MAERTEAEAIADIIDRAPEVQRVDSTPIIALPGGVSVHDLSGYLDRPTYTRAHPVLREVGALAAYLARFERPHSAAFADWEAGKIVAVIDYHEADAANHGTHRATFHARKTPAWQAWSGINGRWIGQADFGRFLEERAVDITKPDAADVMDVVMNLEGVKKVTFTQAQRLHDGFRNLLYKEEDQTKGGIRVPERLELRLPIYEGMEPDRADVFLRFRIEDGNLRFRIDVHQLEDVERVAFERNVDALQTDRPDLAVYRGTP